MKSSTATDIEKLSKQDKLTEEISPRMMEQIARRLRGMKDGAVSILVKEGYVLGIETTDRTHFTSKKQAGREK